MAVDKIKIAYEVTGKKELASVNEELQQMIKKNGLLQKEVDDTTDKFKNQEKQADGLSGTLKKTAGILGAVFAADKIIDFGKEVFRVRGEMQRFSAVLTNTLGSKSEAQKALKTISKFAAETPFSVSQLTASFVKLANQGFKPTANEMRKLGDLASSTGKEFDQLAEAIIDAQTGEFERLKEFGIRASKQGDQVKFTFKGVETQTKFTSEAIKDYVLSLGDLQGVSGSMAAISTTLEGRISNLGDSYETLLNSIGTRGEGIFASAIGALGDLINATNEWVSIPTSDVIKDEQRELNVLVGILNQSNASEAIRAEAINKINTLYPDFLKGIDLEKVGLGQLNTALADVNKEYEKRIGVLLGEESLTAIEKERLELAIEEQKIIRQIAQNKVSISKLDKENSVQAVTIIDRQNAIVRAEKELLEVKEKIASKDKDIAEAQKLIAEERKKAGIASPEEQENADKEAANAKAAKQKELEAKQEAQKIAAAIALEATKEDKKRELEALKEIEKSAKEQDKEDIEEDLDFFIKTTDARLEKILKNADIEQEMKDMAAENDQKRLKESAEKDKERKKEAAEAQEQIALGLLHTLGAVAAEGSSISKAAALAEIVYGTGKGFINGLEIAQKGAAGTGPLAPFTFPVFFATQIAAVLGAASQAKAILSTQAPVPAPKFEHGGRIGGKRHSQGGTMIEAEINEHVMSRRATAKYGHGFFDSLNNLELRADILNGMSGGSSPIIINSDNKELINEYRNRPITNITISENGITKRTQRNNSIIQKKLLRYKS